MRYFLSILAGVVATAAVYGVAFYASLGRTISPSATSIAGWYRHKSEVAESLPGPSLVIVGGSGGLFGIRAGAIEEATGVPTVNYATHGGLTLDYVLFGARRVLRSGDTVLLALEYEMYFAASKLNSVLSDYVLGADPSYFHQLPFRKKLEWIGAASIPQTAKRLRVSDEAHIEYEAKSRTVTSANLNDRGDFVANAKADQGDARRLQVEQVGPMHALSSGLWRSNDQSWIPIGDFVRWCRDRDIRVLATFPNTIARPQYEPSHLRIVAEDIEKHYANFGVPVLGTPADAMFPPEDFYDTVYHMTREGAAKRTAVLVKLLAPHLDAAHHP